MGEMQRKKLREGRQGGGKVLVSGADRRWVVLADSVSGEAGCPSKNSVAYGVSW
ncbi:hypothetical protein OP10G_4759 [Fimbriimonas ginsengisoli Gsoil 348]|uniref:Uncharacterized protein n=1 Tax=Fimbriimonas ginsengisoli Gsoil 348 TaxID=661478 RepID=A0A068NXR1_FIMGI|nr:hypothetical protein OP10G_4759 [Fimbriimonas ginsengisoli Gsoil 348]